MRFDMTWLKNYSMLTVEYDLAIKARFHNINVITVGRTRLIMFFKEMPFYTSSMMGHIMS